MDHAGNNYDLGDAEEVDGPQPLTKAKREEDWKNGVHTTSEGFEWQITDMTDLHIENTIEHFKYRLHYDTRPLEEELKRRKLLKKTKQK